MGICTQCRKNEATKENVLCQDCLDKRRNDRKDIIKSGICSSCFLLKQKKGSTYCENCLRKFRERRKNFKKNSLCVKCGKLPIPGSSMCEECYFKETSYRYFGTNNKWQELKNKLDAQKKCPYTGDNLIVGINTETDHIKARGSGGSRNDINNMQWVSKLANRAKWNQSEKEFLDLVKKIYIYRSL